MSHKLGTAQTFGGSIPPVRHQQPQMNQSNLTETLIKTLIRSLATEYKNNDQLTNLRTLATTLRELSEEVHGTANEIEEQS